MSTCLTQLFVFAFPISISEGGTKIKNAQGRDVSVEEALSSLKIRVGDVVEFSLVLRDSEGKFALIERGDQRYSLKYSSDKYGVLPYRSEGVWRVQAREVTSAAATVKIICKAKKALLWKTVGQAQISISVDVGERFVVTSRTPLEDVPMAYWMYDRIQMRSMWQTARRPRQYIVATEGLGMHAKQEVEVLAWARCDSLASGWLPQPLQSVTSSEEKALICGQLTSSNTFSLNCRRKSGKEVAIKAIDASGNEHILAVKVLPEAQKEKWQGLEESPLFRTKRGLFWRKMFRGTGAVLCTLFLAIWMMGCLLAQINAKGVLGGIGYTAGALGMGLGIVVIMTAIIFISQALTLMLFRKVQGK